MSLTGTIEGAAITNGQTVPLLTLALGFHTLFVSTSDLAGNTSLTTVTFRIVATIDTLIGAVNTFIAAGQIDASGGRSLLSKLEDAKQLLSRGNLAAARNKLADFKTQVSAQSGRSISPSAAQLLIADADYVLGTLYQDSWRSRRPLPGSPYLPWSSPAIWRPAETHARFEPAVQRLVSISRAVFTHLPERTGVGTHSSPRARFQARSDRGRQALNNTEVQAELTRVCGPQARPLEGYWCRITSKGKQSPGGGKWDPAGVPGQGSTWFH